MERGAGVDDDDDDDDDDALARRVDGMKLTCGANAWT